MTFRCANNSNDWKTIPILDLTSLMSAPGVLMCSPRSRTTPSVGSISRLMHRSTVDLPLPEEPMIATDSPSFTSKETPRTAWTPPE